MRSLQVSQLERDLVGVAAELDGRRFQGQDSITVELLRAFLRFAPALLQPDLEEDVGVPLRLDAESRLALDTVGRLRGLLELHEGPGRQADWWRDVLLVLLDGAALALVQGPPWGASDCRDLLEAGMDYFDAGFIEGDG